MENFKTESNDQIEDAFISGRFMAERNLSTIQLYIDAKWVDALLFQTVEEADQQMQIFKDLMKVEQ